MQCAQSSIRGGTAQKGIANGERHKQNIDKFSNFDGFDGITFE